MRGCYLSVDVTGKYLFVAGYHDGKVTVVHTHRDGRLGSVMDGIFHKGNRQCGRTQFPSACQLRRSDPG